MFLLLLLDYLCVLFSVLADLLSGLRKARKRGERCTSSGLRRTVDKIGRYYLALFSMTLIDVLLFASLTYLGESGPDLIPQFPYLTTFGALALALIEVKSICEASDEKGDLRQSLTLLLSLLRRFGIL
ncbi:MAG: phage holin family protein [Bacteroides sp.]|nr:phage holin family protein [Bacteroides sp.]